MNLFSKMRKVSPTFAIPTQGELRLAKDLEELSFHRQLAGKTSVRITFPHGRCEANKLNFVCVISPVEGMYQGGTFEFHFVVPPDYPFRAPMVTCLTEVFHPNIDYKTGYVGLNLLYQDWKPVLSINTIIFGLQLLFLEPNSDGVANKAAAALLGCDRAQFESVVRSTLVGGYVLGHSWNGCLTEEFKTQSAYHPQSVVKESSTSSKCLSSVSTSQSAPHLQQLQFKACGFMLQRDTDWCNRFNGAKGHNASEIPQFPAILPTPVRPSRLNGTKRSRTASNSFEKTPLDLLLDRPGHDPKKVCSVVNVTQAVGSKRRADKFVSGLETENFGNARSSKRCRPTDDATPDAFIELKFECSSLSSPLEASPFSSGTTSPSRFCSTAQLSDTTSSSSSFGSGGTPTSMILDDNLGLGSISPSSIFWTTSPFDCASPWGFTAVSFSPHVEVSASGSL